MSINWQAPSSRDVLGRSPLDYFQSLRIERAVHLLKTSDASVEEVAAKVGYADGATLRTCCGEGSMPA